MVQIKPNNKKGFILKLKVIVIFRFIHYHAGITVGTGILNKITIKALK